MCRLSSRFTCDAVWRFGGGGDSGECEPLVSIDEGMVAGDGDPAIPAGQLQGYASMSSQASVGPLRRARASPKPAGGSGLDFDGIREVVRDRLQAIVGDDRRAQLVPALKRPATSDTLGDVNATPAPNERLHTAMRGRCPDRGQAARHHSVQLDLPRR